MQTILGAGGVIGTALAKELRSYTDRIRLANRNPKAVHPTDELCATDLLLPEDVAKAVRGSEVVYLTAGLTYNTRIWQEQWPRIMRHVLDACKGEGSKLVFFDNVYLYDRDHLHHMTEETPVRPASKKGAVRAAIAQMLLDEVRNGSLTALIARSADFIAPKGSILVEMVYNNLKKGKKAGWFCDAGRIHSFTYSGDAARGTALLGNTPMAFNQVWHLPTIHEKLTGREWIGLIAAALHRKPQYREFPAWMVGLLGTFVPILRELREMTYQYDRDYYFDSSKFEAAFGVHPVSAETAVQKMVEALEGRDRE